MLNLLKTWEENWIVRSLVVGFIGLLLLSALLFQLGNYASGFSPMEFAYRASVSSARLIYQNPVYLPHKVLSYLVIKSGHHGALWLRSVSFTFALLWGVSFYYVVRSLFGKSAGLMGAAIFLVTPLYLVTARQASPEITLFFTIAVMAAYQWLIRTERNAASAWLALLIASVLSLYIPGLIYFVIVGLIICRDKITVSLDKLSKQFVAFTLFIGCILLLPMAASAVNDWHFLKQLTLIPATWPSVTGLASSIGWMGLGVFLKTPHHYVLIVDRLPVLSVIPFSLLVFGTYALWTVARNKAVSLIIAILFSIIAGGVLNDISFIILGLPAAGILVCAGIRYLYIEWRSVFPRNPLARNFAIVVMALVVGIQIFYGIRYSLIAWPHTMATKATYVLK